MEEKASSVGVDLTSTSQQGDFRDATTAYPEVPDKRDCTTGRRDCRSYGTSDGTADAQGQAA